MRAVTNPTHRYSSAGTYTVNLTVTNASGSSSLLRSNYITVSATPVKPVASFSGTPVSGNAPLTVVFTDSSTGSSITNRRWDFGDGNISNYGALTNPTHRYTSAGTYSVNLTVTNASGSNSQLRSNYVTAIGSQVTFVASTSGSSDAEVYRASSASGETFSSLRNGAGTGAIPADGYLTLGLRSSNNNIANSYDLLRRNVFLFNTSGLPDNAIINSVTLSVWSGTSVNFKNQLVRHPTELPGSTQLHPGW